MKMKRRSAAVLLIGIIFLTCSCRQKEKQVPPSGKVVKIGVIAPMSGPDKQSGESALYGIRTALQLQPYLKNGDKLELVVVDNRGTPEDTLTVMAELSKEREVAGVLLMAKSDAVLTLVPFADRFGVPILALNATHPNITKNNSFISQLGFDDIYQGTVAALYVRDEMLIKKVAVFSDPVSPHYSLLGEEFSRKFASVGGEIVEHIAGIPQAEEMKRILKSLQEKNVKLLYLAVPPEEVISIDRTAEAIGWKPEMLGTDGLVSAIFLRYPENIGQLDGMMNIDFYSGVLPKTEYGKKVIGLFEKSFSVRGTSYSGLGCEGASILIHALDRCDDPSDRMCVNSMLRDTKGFIGLFGRISIYENGKSERPIFVNVIDGQELKFLVKVY